MSKGLGGVGMKRIYGVYDFGSFLQNMVFVRLWWFMWDY